MGNEGEISEKNLNFMNHFPKGFTFLSLKNNTEGSEP